jgi:hypothetical protein
MNKNIFIAFLLLVTLTAVAEDVKEQWHDTTLSDATIQKIQQAGFDYKKCASDEMQKEAYQREDSKTATESVVKACEPVLSKMRDVYLEEKVPEIVADRHLKQMRIRLTRNVLQEMMYLEAARSNNPK